MRRRTNRLDRCIPASSGPGPSAGDKHCEETDDQPHVSPHPEGHKVPVRTLRGDERRIKEGATYPGPAVGGYVVRDANGQALTLLRHEAETRQAGASSNPEHQSRLKTIPNHPVCSRAHAHTTMPLCVVIPSRPILRSAYRDFVEVHFALTRRIYTFTRLTAEREVAEFRPLSPDPAIKHASRASGTSKYDAADVLAMAFRLATAAARAGT